jgi:DNA-binding NtrC family response regulator
MTLAHVSNRNDLMPETLVLVVEDDPILRFTLSAEVGRAGFLVRQAASADEAEALLETGLPVSVVVTDIEMPGTRDGLALAKAVRAFHPHIKLIVASGVLPSSGLDGVADAVFGKPYNSEHVILAIRSLLDESD